jgi:glycosyltransferase involved in cell wall biosynthesis
MNVGIDVTSLIYGRGVSRYTANLVKALAKRRDIKLSLYGSSFRQKTRLQKLAENVISDVATRPQIKIQSIPPSFQNVLWNWVGQNKIKKVFPRLDVFHSWDWLQPPDKNLPLVSTIHDLAILKFPQTAHTKILKLHQQSWKVLKEREAQIIAVSRATKKDIVELLGIPAARVHVIYEALPTEVAEVSQQLTEGEEERIKQKFNLNKPYLLFVGTREPRKNLERLIKAWEPLAKEVQLIIAGDTGWDETSKVKATNSELRFLGRVSDKELAVLYSEAEVFVYPSLYEGFGLPILEAFYHGVPVVTSNNSGMLEVAGNAAELIEPESVESIRKGIKTVLNEPSEAQKKRLQRMVIRLHLFSWERVAEETVEVYRRAVEVQS